MFAAALVCETVTVAILPRVCLTSHRSTGYDL
jgi:hypothetical protein